MSTVLYVTLHPENEGMEAAGQLRGCEDAAEERKEERRVNLSEKKEGNFEKENVLGEKK